MASCWDVSASARWGGALGNARLRARLANEHIIRVAFLAFAASSLALALSRSPVVSGAALVLAGAGWVIALSLFNVTLQLSTPRWVVGRVLALYQTGVFGGMAAGSWAWGALSESFGTGLAMLLAAGLLVIGALAGLVLPVPDAADRDLAPLNTFREPALRLDLRQRSGPIMIMVDYEIAQSDVPDFLAAMNARRHIRIRDGAQQWALLRDLENPDIWTESYHFPTWVDYVRHHERRTQSDADPTQQLLKLHRGAGTPKVHRMIERQTIPLEDDMPLVRPTDSTES